MGPRTTMKEAEAAERFNLRFRAMELNETHALEETSIELCEQGYTPTGVYRDYKTVQAMIRRIQAWRKQTSARRGVTHEVIAQRFDASYWHNPQGLMVVYAIVLAGSIGAYICRGA